jgi:hypothetical protein
MVILQTAKTALNVAAVVILAPLFILFIALPLLAYWAVLDCVGIIKEPRDWSHWASS